jgi:hypothetical protein
VRGAVALIQYRRGDATAPAERPAAILHVVNDKGLWGAGFSGALDRAYNGAPGRFYRQWSRGELSSLSGYPLFGLDAVLWQRLGDQLALGHLCAQRGVGRRCRRVDYNALRLCLGDIGAPPTNLSFHLPRIGTGYGGGRWEEVEAILNDTIAKAAPTYVYDLPGAPP